MATPAHPALDSIDHIHVFVTDRAASERWYAEVLGLTRIPEYEFWASGGGPLTLRSAHGKVQIALFERPREKCRSTIAFGVDAPAFLAWQTHLKRVLGEAPSLEDHDLAWSLYFCDPDGNPYEITSYEYQTIQQALDSKAT